MRLTKTHIQRLAVAIAAVAISLAGISSYAQDREDRSGVSRTFPEPGAPATASEYAPSVGAHTGVSGTEGKYDSTLGWGVEAAYQPYIPYTLGLDLNGYSASAVEELPGVTRTSLLAKAAYNFGGVTPVLRYSFLGLEAGPVFDNISNTSYVSLGIAPVVGFDIPLGATNTSASRFTLGAAGSYLFVSNNKPDVLLINAAGKYWF